LINKDQFLLPPRLSQLFVIDQKSAIDPKKPCNSSNRREIQSRKYSYFGY